MRKVTVEVRLKVELRADEGVEIGEVLNEAEYNFEDTTGHADIEDTEIVDYTIIDSR